MLDELVIAHHEAGHALLAENYGAHVLRVTIEPHNDEGPRRHGETTIAWRETGINGEELSLRKAQVALAGPVAEMIYCELEYDVEVIQEWWADWLMAANAIRSVRGDVVDSDLLKLVDLLVGKLRDVLGQDHVWHRLATIADELAAHQTLESEQLDQLREDGFL